MPGGRLILQNDVRLSVRPPQVHSNGALAPNE